MDILTLFRRGLRRVLVSGVVQYSFTVLASVAFTLVVVWPFCQHVFCRYALVEPWKFMGFAMYSMTPTDTYLVMIDMEAPVYRELVVSDEQLPELFALLEFQTLWGLVKMDHTLAEDYLAEHPSQTKMRLSFERSTFDPDFSRHGKAYILWDYIQGESGEVERYWGVHQPYWGNLRVSAP